MLEMAWKKGRAALDEGLACFVRVIVGYDHDGYYTHGCRIRYFRFAADPAGRVRSLWRTDSGSVRKPAPAEGCHAYGFCLRQR
ncbi:hypothetical protein [Paenibacillus elgii]|uniref:hypothetical protein n=1 Tax=Paenibacillus elgii TaxID=189691 RepID=UPI0030DBE2C1